MSGRRATSRQIASYADFWPHYLSEHSRPQTRAIHLAGTAAALSCLGAGLITGHTWYILLALGAGYGPAWMSHFLVEKNRPATFTHPLWSLVSDFRMAWCWSTGKLGRELEKAGVSRR